MAVKVRSGGARSKSGAKWFREFVARQAQCWTGGHNTRELARRCAGCGEPIQVGEMLPVKVIEWRISKESIHPRRSKRWEYWHRACWRKLL